MVFVNYRLQTINYKLSSCQLSSNIGQLSTSYLSSSNMLLFPNCKINLGLNITGKRDDGFHNLQTVFLPVPMQDVLEVIASHNTTQPVIYSHSGLQITGEESDNLCIKAYHLLKNDFPQLPGVAMHLHKVIPMGAGLGGGSADGAFTLLLLNKKFSLGIGQEQLISYALQLGSDCPFFIINTPCFAEGRGEKLEKVTMPLSGYTLVLVNPGIHIPTGWAFSQIKPAKPAKSVKAIVSQPVSTWKEELANDFEKPVIAAYPQLQSIKHALYQQGAIYASMSGSGSTFYGLFASNPQIPANIFPAGYFVKTVVL